jgi:hypothetical protein
VKLGLDFLKSQCKTETLEKLMQHTRTT